jgi:hypothetical protein
VDDGDNDTCLQLALEGEKLCKGGNCRDGVAFFEAALQAGTDDFRTLSAIYSQLGNAYFYMGDYVKAMQYHKHDLTLARTMGDRLGEAKASGNLGNTLKVLGKFDEAVICCRRHLEICQEHSDRVGEGRALYNLGNVYHAKGKHIGRLGHQDPGEFPEEVGITVNVVFYICSTPTSYNQGLLSLFPRLPAAHIKCNLNEYSMSHRRRLQPPPPPLHWSLLTGEGSLRESGAVLRREHGSHGGDRRPGGARTRVWQPGQRSLPSRQLLQGHPPSSSEGKNLLTLDIFSFVTSRGNSSCRSD